ncbi:MAG TPA: fimbria/pilus periplasmic chaperone [Edaphobacter sp.]|nr:fimbria/pilus periplasmic chaperone [Edaphobacter sp.]
MFGRLTSIVNHRNLVLISSAVLFLNAGNARAGSFSVNPVRVEIFEGHTSAVVQIQNLAEEPVTVQAHIVAWSQKDGEEIYADTDEILLNPPIFTIQPKQSQFVRLGLRQPKLISDGELAYRLILEEVPKPPKPGFTGLQTVLRISLPIFAKPRQQIASPLLWRAEVSTDGALRVTAVNQGKAHIQVQHLAIATLETPSGTASVQRADYVLAGQSRTWIFSNSRVEIAHNFSLTATTDAGEVHETLAATSH